MTHQQAVLDTVKIIHEVDGRYVVEPVWKDVDRPTSGSCSCGKNHDLAIRLAKAIKAGVLWDLAPKIQIDAVGKTYVNSMLSINMRHANSELKMLGY